jgi:hypothetical protein
VNTTTNPMNLPADDVHHRLGSRLRRLSNYSETEISHRLEHYFKMMFVRDPFERLIATFRSKFHNGSYTNYFKQRYGTLIAKTYRKNPSRTSLKYGNDVTFVEFVKYLLDTEARKLPQDALWRQYWKTCHPCMVQYHAIGKFETFTEDVDFVLRLNGLDHKVKFPPGSAASSRGAKTSSLVRREYSKLPAEDVHRLWQMYALDFRMFGYKYPDIPS